MSAPVTTTTPTTKQLKCTYCESVLKSTDAVFCDEDCAGDFADEQEHDEMMEKLQDQEETAQAKVDAKLRLLKQFRHELDLLVEDVCKAQKARMPEDGLCDQRDLCFECWGADCCRDGDYYDDKHWGADFCLEPYKH